jgi:HAE1 family hydrophobic/amphiphilic exporter-1
MRSPMAITVIGGLLTSTLLTLVVVPVMYTVLDRRPDTIAAAEAKPAPDTLSGAAQAIQTS